MKTANPKITEDIHHKVKATDRRRQAILVKNDIENGLYDGEQLYVESFNGTHPKPEPLEMPIMGEYRKEKLARKKYKKMIWKVFLFLLSLPILYVLVINLFGI